MKFSPTNQVTFIPDLPPTGFAVQSLVALAPTVLAVTRAVGVSVLIHEVLFLWEPIFQTAWRVLSDDDAW
jgi:hypothetical protein